MITKYFKRTDKGALFICSVSENALKVTKCLFKNAGVREFADAVVEPLEAGQDEKQIAEKLGKIFKQLGYNNNPVIVSLSRQNVTTRYLKIPAQAHQEIEKIISLQAARYLPYPASELVTAYQVISADKDGYSNINLVIAHKGVINRLIKIVQALNIKNPQIILSSFGLIGLYSVLEPQDAPALTIDIDASGGEAIVARKGKMLFSRSFKLNRQQQGWQELLTQEVQKTLDAYSKERIDERPQKAVIFSAPKISGINPEELGKKINITVAQVPYWEKVPSQKNFLDAFLDTEYSFADLVGLGIKEPEANFSLLPLEMKEGVKEASLAKERLRLGLFIAAILFIAVLGLAKNIQNKADYLKLIRKELAKIEPEAKSLEEIDRRFNLMEARLKKKPTTLDIIHELYRVIPQDITLNTLSYEENNQTTLRGNTLELNSVFRLVAELEKSAVFRGFNIKVRYASKKRTQAGEVVDFEIICAKK